MIHPNMERVKDQLNSVCDKTVCMQSEGIIYTLTNSDTTKENLKKAIGIS